jgi:hypothetical protein
MYIQHALINIVNCKRRQNSYCCYVFMSYYVLFHGDMYLKILPETIDGEYDVDNKKKGEARH